MDQPSNSKILNLQKTPWISGLAGLFKKNFPAKILVVEEVILIMVWYNPYIIYYITG